MGHVSRLRFATIGLLLIVALFTLTFVISASMALHTEYGMTRITVTQENPVVRFILGLQTVTTCDSEWSNCDTVKLSSDEAKSQFDTFLAGEKCPISAGNWVIASQSLVLVLMIWPIIALIKTDMQVRWKRATSLGLLLFSLFLSFTAIGVWYAQCVHGFNVDKCVDATQCNPVNMTEVKGEVSGAYAFQCIIMIILFVSTVCAFIYQYYAPKSTIGNAPLMNDSISNGDSDDAYYRAY